MCTIPEASFSPDGPWQQSVLWVRGQVEIGDLTGYRHWQLLAAFPRKQSLAGVRRVFGADGHYELTRSGAADAYVWKDETAVVETRFEY